MTRRIKVGGTWATAIDPGETFGAWTVVTGPAHGLHVRYECRCACGAVGYPTGSSLVAGRTKRCGACARADIRNQFTGTDPWETFWRHVRIGDGCWEWMARKSRDGYGRKLWRGRHVVATRIAYEYAHGAPPPADMLACHHCDNPGCVRPSHIFLGTPKDNTQDMIAKGRGVAVGRVRATGHPMTKLSPDDVRTIRERKAAGAGSGALAREYGVHPATIWKVAKKR